MILTTQTVVPIEAIVRWPRTARVFAKYPQHERDDLIAFIKANGQHALPRLVVTPDYRLIDGYNRLDGAEGAGLTQVEVEVWTYSSDSEAVRHAYLLNLKRRHLDTVTAARAGAEYSDLLEEEAAERANRARAEAARGNDHAAKTRPAVNSPSVITDAPIPRQERSSERAARELGVSDKTIRQVKKVDATGDRPLIEAMEQHRLPIAKAAQLAAQPADVRAAALAAIEEPRQVAAAFRNDGMAYFCAGCIDAINKLQEGGGKTDWECLTDEQLATGLHALGGVIQEAQKWHGKLKEVRNGKAD